MPLRLIYRLKSSILVIKRPVFGLYFFKNVRCSIAMPPKRKNAANKVAVEAEPATNDIPKKRGRKADQVPIEVADEVISAAPEKKTRKGAVKPETKTGKKITKATEVKTKAEEKTAKVSKVVVAQPEEEKAEKKTTRKKAEKVDENKEKPMVKKQKQEASGDKKETKEKKKEEIPKAKATKKIEKAPKATKTEAKPALLNVTETKWDEINFDCEKQNPKGQYYNLKITSWNVDGLRAWLKKDGISILKYDQPDILCLQETKCSEDKLPDEVTGIEGYHDYWCSSDKEGYAGVGVYTKTEPLNVKNGIDSEEHDDEGRCLTLEYSDFYLVNVYVPNAGRGLVTLDKRLEWNEAFQIYIRELDDKKPVILCGDMNVAHNEIDLSNPKTNKKNAGFTQEERDGMTDFLAGGFVDSYRDFYPEQKDVYTFWSYMSKARSKNIGWRLDYFILSQRLMENVCDNVVHSEVYGSDHCPITLFINI